MVNQMKLLGGLIVVNMLMIFTLNVNAGEEEIAIPGLGMVKIRDARIVNALAQGKDLRAHCTSKEQDYGNQTLLYGKYHEFEVKENTGKIICELEWDKKVHHFEIYNVKKYKQECGERCWWMIKETGACLFEMQSKSHIYCYTFKKE